MSSTSGAPRTQKRQRAGQQEISDSDNVRSAVTALLERLIAVRSSAESSRDEHITSIALIDERIAAKQTALRAVARVVPPPPSEDIAAFSRGVPASAPPVELPDFSKPPLPAMKLLVEQDPPEKLIHEQSIIVRAQAINRKNAEMARERLPKQPEAQRNKTHWDYLMDEATWLAADFREERKWKLRVAKSLAKAAATYHIQKKQREARAIKEEHTRMRRLAASVARDVKKFWSQIRELADMRAKELEEIRLKAERQQELDTALRQAGEITSSVAVSLRNAVRQQPPNVAAAVQGAPPHANANSAPSAVGVVVEEKETTVMDKSEEHTLLGPTSPRRDSAEALKDPVAQKEETRDDFNAENADVEDDETTMAAAEAEEANDPKETFKLEAEADMSIEALLASQGIDLASYAADKQKYLSDEDDTESSERSVASSDSDDEPNSVSLPTKLNALEKIGSSSSGQLISPHFAAPSGSRTVAVEKPNPDKMELTTSSEPLGSGPKPDQIQSICAEKPPGSATLETIATSLANTASTSSRPNGNCRVLKEEDKDQTDTPNDSQISSPSGLLRGTLRDYQYAGVQWLITLYKNNLNGILADEMGLGKTIQTIALLAWLALEKGVWGPHLIVVPTSVMVNWEVEFKKWLPGFKILTYFGSLKERKLKRAGWSRPNTFHVCITSYALVVQDAAALRRKEWVYLILDEAHNIKNFQSQRWQTLLRFPSSRRLLLTGTPLQNSIMELWSLMHFLMPDMFQSQAQFKDWFAKPLGSIISEEATDNARESVDKLHEILRPFLLRRLKRDVEKGLPPKQEHVQKCPLSKRQRQLYEDFLSRSDTQNTLQSGDFFGVMGVLMQLRKVCNHPDLFEGRPILSPFAMKPVFYPLPALVMKMRTPSACSRLDLSLLSLDLATDELNGWSGDWHSKEVQRLSAVSKIVEKLTSVQEEAVTPTRGRGKRTAEASLEAARRVAAFRRAVLRHQAQLTSLKVRKHALLGEDLLTIASMTPASLLTSRASRNWDNSLSSNISLTKSLESVVQGANNIFERFICCIRKVTAPTVELRFAGDDTFQWKQRALSQDLAQTASPLRTLFRAAEVRSSVTLPDSRLVQWDCGKLQVLSVLLRKLRSNSSRVLIFSQMTKVLNILESFLNLHAYRYLRLDGATKTGDRQRIVERFNTDTRIFCMILTTRAGGVGLNLTGADTVIFYDTDYNPAIDAQAQDRVHRIGQKKPVHIYRLVSEKTVEENILRRANEKRTLESLVISQAGFNIDSFQNRSALHDLVGIQSVTGSGERSTDALARKPILPSAGVAKERPQGFQSGQSVLQRQANTDSQRQRNGAGSESPSRHILSAHGPVKPLAWMEREAKSTSEEGTATVNGNGDQASLRKLAEQSDVYHRLVVQEDDQAGQGRDSADSDIDDFHDPENGADSSKSKGTRRSGHAPSFEYVERALIPIQRFALKLIEKGSPVQSPSGDDDVYPQADDPPDAEPGDSIADPSASTASLPEPTMNGDALRSLDHSVSNGPVGDLALRESDNEDEDEILFYEQKTTNSAYVSSLKALTDTDANIKLYLPLRDGGPEELKISSVVNGTAAAGLECAEDAAFFPHAYNRMSRTIYATKRQKEKAASNLRKREELEEKRRREASRTAAALRAAGGQRSGHQAIAPADGSGGGIRAVGQKFKQDLSNSSKSGSVPPVKKARFDVANRMKPPHPGTSSSGLPGASSDGSFPGTSGLFRKSIKRNQRRASTLYGKSSINFTANAMFGDTLGKNDGWTMEEDKTVVELVALYSGNMALVADVLAMHPDVASGNRRRRSIRHITERWFNVIQKESKTGQTGPKTSVSGIARSNKNLVSYATAAQKSSSSFHKLDVKSIEFSDMHASHGRAAIESQKKTATKFSPRIPPTLTISKDKIVVPRGHLAGFKAHECTPQALSKKKLPFVRAPRNDSRSSTIRGTGTAQPQQPAAGSGRGTPQPTATSSAKAVLSRNVLRTQAGATPGRGQARVQNPAKVPLPPTRPATQANVKGSSAPRLQNMGPGPIVPPGTSARMSLGQFGNARSTVGPATRVPTAFNVGSTTPAAQTGNRRAQVRSQTPNGTPIVLPGQPTSIRPTPAATHNSVSKPVAALPQQQRRLSTAAARKVPANYGNPAQPQATPGTKKPAVAIAVEQKARVQSAHAAVARVLPGSSKVMNLTTAGPLPQPTIVDNAVTAFQHVPSVSNTKVGGAANSGCTQVAPRAAPIPTSTTARPRQVTAPLAPPKASTVPRTSAQMPQAPSSSTTVAAAMSVTGSTSNVPSLKGSQNTPQQEPVARKVRADANPVVAHPKSCKTAVTTSGLTAMSASVSPPKAPAQIASSVAVQKPPVSSTLAVKNGLQTTPVSNPSDILLESKEEPKRSSQ